MYKPTANHLEGKHVVTQLAGHVGGIVRVV